MADNLQITFQRLLIEDVQHVMAIARASGTGSDCRNLIRTVVSAIEGVAWAYGTYVLEIAKTMDASTPLLESAFSEMTVGVSERGEVLIQRRSITTTAFIRLTTNVAKSICENVEVQFGDVEWAKLKDTIRLRNRITHPKTLHDLSVSDSDMASAEVAFFWFIKVVTTVMEQTLASAAGYVADTKKIMGDLMAGDPGIRSLYNRIILESDD